MTEDNSIVAAEFLQNKDQCILAAQELAEHKQISAKLLSDLRTKFGDTLAGLIAESVSLQDKASRKFSGHHELNLADRSIIWWVTRRSLQQATPWQVAKLKAGWLGDAEVHDLCCAVGGDAISLAVRGATIAVDRDPVMVAMAEANLSTAISLQPALQRSWQTRCEDVVDFQLPKRSTLHIDPDRRTDGQKRGTQAEAFSPTWAEVHSMITNSRSAIVKLAPATDLDCQSSDQPRHQSWISLQGSVREQSLLVGGSVEKAKLTDGGRSAYRLAADGSWQRFAPTDEVVGSVAAASQPSSWLVDPVSSVRAAGLTQRFAADYALTSLGGLSGFLTSDESELPEEVVAMAVVGRVVWKGSANERKLKRELRAHGWFPETVKCRSVDRDPAEVFRCYRDCGDVPVTLWIGRVGKKVYAAVTQ